MNTLSALSFEPIYQDRVWGGRGLETVLGRSLPEGRKIGESWEIVDRQEAQSLVANGTWKGKTLGEILKNHSEALMGPGWPKGQPFPVLVKWLDCQEILSLQVHPPESEADKLGGEPKTENWYVAETYGSASLILGLQEGVSREQFELALKEGRLEECVYKFESMPGDSILVESGRLHAIDAGNLILEIQQNSDTTYRVYDWGRVGLDGKPRDLHISESLQCIDFEDFEPEPIRLPETTGKVDTLVDCSEFVINRHVLAPGDELNFPARQTPHLLSLVKGAIQEDSTGETYSRGHNLLVPYAADCHFQAVEQATLLVTKPRF